MLRERFKNTLNWGITIFCVIACSVLFSFFLYRIDQVMVTVRKILSVLSPVTWGLVITFLLNPLMQRIEQGIMLIPARSARTKSFRRLLARILGILLSEVFLLAVLVFLVRIVLPQLLDSISMLVLNIGDYANGFEAWITPLIEETSDTVRLMVENAIDQVRDWVSSSLLQDDFMKLLGNVTTGVVLVGRTLYNFILGLIVSIYLLSSKQRMIALFKKCVYALFRPVHANHVMSALREANRMFRGFVIGKIVDSAIIGVLCFIGTSLLKMPFAILVSVIVGITNVIPYFGPFIGAVPSILLILMIDPIKSLIFAVFILFLQQLDGNFIGPKILGDRTGVSPFGVLFSILVGGGLFGFIGMIVAVPTFGLIFQLGKHAVETRLRRWKMPLETSAYAVLDHVDLSDDGTPCPVEKKAAPSKAPFSSQRSPQQTRKKKKKKK